MSSRVLPSLGNLHIVTGTIDCTQATDAVLTSNDDSATMARSAAGEYVVTFGQAFRAAPTVVACPISAIGTATVSTDQVVVNVEGVSATGATFMVMDVVGGTDATQSAQSDAQDICFIAIGSRDV